MKQCSPSGIRRFHAMLLATLLGATVGVVSASASSDEQALAKGAMADVTPQQKYSTAIREAGGAYKEWLRECNNGPADLRRACVAEAKSTYDQDMARAKMILATR
ncbi:MAG: hypothetical protein ABI583_04445 [Betaproteobacteria bacterium]